METTTGLIEIAAIEAFGAFVLFMRCEDPSDASTYEVATGSLIRSTWEPGIAPDLVPMCSHEVVETRREINPQGVTAQPDPALDTTTTATTVGGGIFFLPSARTILRGDPYSDPWATWGNAPLFLLDLNGCKLWPQLSLLEVVLILTDDK